MHFLPINDWENPENGQSVHPGAMKNKMGEPV